MQETRQLPIFIGVTDLEGELQVIRAATVTHFGRVHERLPAVGFGPSGEPDMEYTMLRAGGGEFQVRETPEEIIRMMQGLPSSRMTESDDYEQPHLEGELVKEDDKPASVEDRPPPKKAARRVLSFAVRRVLGLIMGER